MNRCAMCGEKVYGYVTKQGLCSRCERVMDKGRRVVRR